MISSRAVALATVTLASVLSASGQSGPAGDKSVAAVAIVVDAQSSQSPTVVAAKMNEADDQRELKYSAGPSDRKVWALQYKVENVREMWLKSDKQNATEIESIRTSALESANALSGIPDGQLRLGGLINKDEYACFGYIIAGANTSSKSAQSLLAKKAERSCKRAALQLSKADQPEDSNAIAVREWEIHSEEHPRIAYLLAMSKCLEGSSSGDERFKAEARTILSSEIPQYYLERYPPEHDYVLHACVSH